MIYLGAVEHHLVDILLQSTGVLKRGQGVDINYTLDTSILSLETHVVLYSSQVISQMLPTCGASSRKDTTLHSSLLSQKV